MNVEGAIGTCGAGAGSVCLHLSFLKNLNISGALELRKAKLSHLFFGRNRVNLKGYVKKGPEARTEANRIEEYAAMATKKQDSPLRRGEGDRWKRPDREQDRQ